MPLWTSVNDCRSTSVFFKLACHPNPFTARRQVGSSLLISIRVVKDFEYFHLYYCITLKNRSLILAKILYSKIFPDSSCVFLISIRNPFHSQITVELFFLGNNVPLHLYQLCMYHQKTFFNPLSANPTKWSNTFKQFVGKLSTNCLSVFDHFVKLALKGLIVLLQNLYMFANLLSKSS